MQALELCELEMRGAEEGEWRVGVALWVGVYIGRRGVAS
jgi:hypothetical protein